MPAARCRADFYRQRHQRRPGDREAVGLEAGCWATAATAVQVLRADRGAAGLLGHGGTGGAGGTGASVAKAARRSWLWEAAHETGKGSLC